MIKVKGAPRKGLKAKYFVRLPRNYYARVFHLSFFRRFDIRGVLQRVAEKVAWDVILNRVEINLDLRKLRKRLFHKAKLYLPNLKTGLILPMLALSFLPVNVKALTLVDSRKYQVGDAKLAVYQGLTINKRKEKIIISTGDNITYSYLWLINNDLIAEDTIPRARSPSGSKKGDTGTHSVLFAHNRLWMFGYDWINNLEMPWIACYDTTGTKLWENYYSDPGDAYLIDEKGLVNTDFGVMFYFMNSNGERFTGVDTLGNVVYSVFHASSTVGTPYEMNNINDTIYTAGGYYRSTSYEVNTVVATLHAQDGSLINSKEYNFYPSNDDLARTITFDGDYLYIAGGRGYPSDIIVAKLDRQLDTLGFVVIQHPNSDLNYLVYDSCEDSAGLIDIAGYVDGWESENIADTAFIYRFDKNLNLVEVYKAGLDSCRIYCIEALNDSMLVAYGSKDYADTTDTTTSWPTVWLFKYEQTGIARRNRAGRQGQSNLEARVLNNFTAMPVVKFSNACSWAVYDVAGRKIANGYGNEVDFSNLEVKPAMYFVVGGDERCDKYKVRNKVMVIK